MKDKEKRISDRAYKKFISFKTVNSSMNQLSIKMRWFHTDINSRAQKRRLMVAVMQSIIKSKRSEDDPNNSAT
jgi:hypothetical protein